MQTLEQRREAFRQRLIDFCDKNDPECIKYPKWLRKEFWEKWTAVIEGGSKVRKKDIGKMEFEIQDTWSTGGRLATFVNNSKHWHPKKWMTEQEKPVQKIQTQQSDYQPTIDYDKYKERMKNEPKRRGNIGELIRRQR